MFDLQIDKKKKKNVINEKVVKKNNSTQSKYFTCGCFV